METESAPSGEWEEYNYSYMIQEAVVWAWQEAYYIISKKKNDQLTTWRALEL